MSSEAHKTGKLPTVADLLASPLFTIPGSTELQQPTRLKISTSAKVDFHDKYLILNAHPVFDRMH